MRRLIATVSMCCAVGFAVALANSPVIPPGTGGSTEEIHGPNAQGAGVAGDDQNQENPAPRDAMGDPRLSSRSPNSQSQTVQSCTDSNGVTYYRGKTGFNGCIKRSQTPQPQGDDPRQMGGTVGNPNSESENPPQW